MPAVGVMMTDVDESPGTPLSVVASAERKLADLRESSRRENHRKDQQVVLYLQSRPRGATFDQIAAWVQYRYGLRGLLERLERDGQVSTREGKWHAGGTPPVVQPEQGTRADRVLRVVRRHPEGISSLDVARAIDEPSDAVNRTLVKLRADGVVRHNGLGTSRARYFPLPPSSEAGTPSAPASAAEPSEEGATAQVVEVAAQPVSGGAGDLSSPMGSASSAGSLTRQPENAVAPPAPAEEPDPPAADLALPAVAPAPAEVVATENDRQREGSGKVNGSLFAKLVDQSHELLELRAQLAARTAELAMAREDLELIFEAAGVGGKVHRVQIGWVVRELELARGRAA